MILCSDKLSLVLALGLGLTALPGGQAATATDLDAFLAKIRSDQGPLRVEAIMAAGPMGAPAVVPLGAVADGPEREPGIAARRALMNIAAYAGRPGGGDDRKAVAAALLQLLPPPHTKLVRTLTLELLSWTGDDAVVPAVAALCADPDPDVRDEAKRALQAIPGPASLKALIELAGKTDGEFRLAVFAALGQRAAPEAAEVLIAATASPDLQTVLAALDALARIGIAKDDRVKLPPWESLDSAQRLRLANSYLRWADQRAAKGATDDALAVYNLVLEHGPAEHLICAALIGDAHAAPDQAFDAVLKALAHQENTVRLTAVHLLEQQHGDDANTTALLEAYKQASPLSRELLLRVLAAWNHQKLGN